MNRRNVLLGLGTAAAGSGIVFGSGAFTQVQAERDITIGVSTDENALVELKPNDSIESVFQSDSGELAVDTGKLSDEERGLNVGSTVQIGATTESFGDEVDVADPAFEIINRFDDSPDATDFGTIDIGVDLTGIIPDEEDQIESLEFIATRSESDDGDSLSSEVIQAGDRKVLSGLEPASSDADDDRVAVAIRVETSNTDGTFSIDDAIAIQAGSDLTADNFPNEQAAPANTIENQQTGSTFSTIQNAVNDASPGDTLILGPGTFDESVTIDVEGLTLEGPNAGTPGGNTRGTEATVNQGVEISADSATVNGLEVTSSEVNGIVITEAPSNVTVTNTVVRDIAGGTAGASKGVGNGINLQFNDVADQTSTGIKLTNNLITRVTTPNASGSSPDADAIGVQLLPRGNDVEDLRVANNTISDIQPGAAPGGRSEARAVSIATQFTDTSGGTRGDLGQATNLTVADNDISKLTADFARAVNLFEDEDGDTTTNDALGPVNFTITGNTVSGVTSEDLPLDLALFVGKYGDFGDHSVQDNNFDATAVENFGSSDTLNANGNVFTGTPKNDVFYVSKSDLSVVKTNNTFPEAASVNANEGRIEL